MNDPTIAELWHPDREESSYGDAAWLGAAWGISMHAIVNFFALWFGFLNPVLALFAPAQRLAFGITAGAPPFARWTALILSEGLFWALVAIALLASWREIESHLHHRA